MELLANLDVYALWGIAILGIPVGGYAFVHALVQRSDAFTAADRLTKPAWLGITGASLLILILFQGGWPQEGPGIRLVFHGGPSSTGGLFWLAALVAVLVYIVDVKPAVVRVQGGGQRW